MAEPLHARIVIDTEAVNAEVAAIKANPTPDWEQRLKDFVSANTRFEVA